VRKHLFDQIGKPAGVGMRHDQCGDYKVVNVLPYDGDLCQFHGALLW
jgi:hypothetical protein